MRQLKLTLFILWGFSSQVWAQNLCPQQYNNQNLTNKAFNAKTGLHNLDTAVMDYASAEYFFKEIQKEKYRIPYKYVVDGCDVRAMMAAKILSDRHIKSFRVFLDSPSGDLFLKTPYTLEGFLSTDRHSALALCVKNPKTNIVEPYILDPSFFSKPVPVKEWKEAFTADMFPQDQEKARLNYGSMYSLTPSRRASSFSERDLEATKQLGERFYQEHLNVERGRLPEGVGRSKEQIRSEYSIR